MVAFGEVTATSYNNMSYLIVILIILCESWIFVVKAQI